MCRPSAVIQQGKRPCRRYIASPTTYALPVYFGYLTEGQRHMLQRVLHRASSRGFTPYYYGLDTLERTLIIIFLATAAAKLIVSIICTQLNLGHLAPCSREPVVISLHCLLLNVNSTNKTLLFDRFSIMYNLWLSVVLSSCLYFIVHTCECHMY